MGGGNGWPSSPQQREADDNAGDDQRQPERATHRAHVRSWLDAKRWDRRDREIERARQLL
jgi:hypothetical protein